MIKYFTLLLVVMIAISCTSTKTLYNWKGYDDAVYSYIKNSDEKSIDHLLMIYTKLIQNSGGLRNLPPPGVCADYGYLLIKKGETVKGREFLIKETVLYPESKPFIDRIIKRFDK